MHELGTHEPPKPLEYVTTLDATGDVRAERVVTLIVKWLLIGGLAITLIRFAFGIIFLVRNGNDWLSLYTQKWFAHYIVTVVFLFLCVRALATRSPYRNSLLVATFVVHALLPWLFAGELEFRDALVNVGFRSIDNCRIALYLLILPLLAGKPSDRWLLWLNRLSIILLLLLLSDWVQRNINEAFVYARGPSGKPEYISLGWIRAGFLVGAAGLFCLRHEHNRILIRLVAVWALFSMCVLLWDARRELEYLFRVGGEFNATQMFYLAMEGVNHLVSFLPLWLLVWFSFRFNDAERRALGQMSASTVER